MNKLSQQINLKNILNIIVIIVLSAAIFVLLLFVNRNEERKNKYYTQELESIKEVLDKQIVTLEDLMEHPEKISEVVVDEYNQCESGMLSLYREFDNLANVITVLEENTYSNGVAVAIHDVASGLAEFKEFCDFEESEDELLTRADLLVYLERVHGKFVEWQAIMETEEEPMEIMFKLSEAADYNPYNRLYYVNDLLNKQ